MNQMPVMPGIPFSELYWHIGETPIRFRSVTPRKVKGSKSSGIQTPSSVSEPKFLCYNGNVQA